METAALSRFKPYGYADTRSVWDKNFTALLNHTAEKKERKEILTHTDTCDSFPLQADKRLIITLTRSTFLKRTHHSGQNPESVDFQAFWLFT